MAVRVRPLLKAENALKAGKKSTDIMRVMDGKVVVVLDPDESKVWEERGHRGEPMPIGHAMQTMHLIPHDRMDGHDAVTA